MPEKKYKHKGYRFTVQLPVVYAQLIENYAVEIAQAPVAVAAQRIIKEKLDQLVKDGVLEPKLSDKARADLLQEYLIAIAEGKHRQFNAEKLREVVGVEVFESLILKLDLDRPEFTDWGQLN